MKGLVLEQFSGGQCLYNMYIIARRSQSMAVCWCVEGALYVCMSLCTSVDDLMLALQIIQSLYYLERRERERDWCGRWGERGIIIHRQCRRRRRRECGAEKSDGGKEARGERENLIHSQRQSFCRRWTRGRDRESS